MMTSPSPPPEKKFKELATITMVVEHWGKHQLEQLSSIVRVHDYNWRLRLHKYDSKLRYLSLICDKSKEAALWECIATVKSEFSPDLKDISFASWIEESTPRYLTLNEFVEGQTLSLEVIAVKGACPRLRPILDPYAERDAIIWIGRQKVHVNKESLSVQSEFFTEFFANEHKRNKPNEFVLSDVTYEEFRHMLNLYYGFDGASITDSTITSTLLLANRYDLKILEDLVVSHLLSPSTSMSIHQRLFIGDKSGLPFLKARIIRLYTAALVKELGGSPEWDHLSKETTRAILNKRCDM